MTWLSSRLWAFRQTLLGIAQSKALFALSLLLSALALTIPVFLAVLAWSISSPLLSVSMETEITVFTKRTSTEAQGKAVQKQLTQMPLIASTQWIPKQEAYQMVTKSLGIQPGKNRTNPLPHVIIATVRNDASSEDIASLSSRIEKLPDVETVAYDDKWAKHLSALVETATVLFGLLGSVIFALVLLVIAASIRMSTNAQKDEIRALYLFGATNAFIRRPYVWRGFLLMGLSSSLALWISSSGIALLTAPVRDFAQLYGAQVTLSMPQASWCMAFVLGCALVGALVAGLATTERLYALRRR